jgi:NAD-dependent deacetylase
MKSFYHNDEYLFNEWNWTKDSKLFVLTGAGISAESGVSTFRDSGLWDTNDVQKVATPQGYATDPQNVIDFHNDLRQRIVNAEPNNAHKALAKLQTELGERCFLVTQNVDDLHERGGSPQVSHMHGEINSLKCVGPER